MQNIDLTTNLSSFLEKNESNKPAQSTCALDNETILQIQSKISSILDINPLNINEEAVNIFNDLEKIVNSNVCINILPEIVPLSVYPQLVLFLSKTKDEKVNYITCRLITALTNGPSNLLSEFLRHGLLEILSKLITNFSFPKSTSLLFQIISNYLSDQNEEISMKFHKEFKFELLVRIFQYIKCSISNNMDQYQDLLYDILNSWMKCIYITISKYHYDGIKYYPTLVLIEITRYFNLFFEDENLCKTLYDYIITLIDNNLLNFSDFALYDYPELFENISQNSSNDEIKSYALRIIGKLIEVNRYSLSFNLMDHINSILNTTEKTSSKLLSSEIFVCLSCLKNSIVANDTFEMLDKFMPKIIKLYENQKYFTQLEMINLFIEYVNHFNELKIIELSKFQSTIFEIAKIFFEFMQESDNFDLIFEMLKAIELLNNNLIDFDYINSPYTSDYLTNLIECMKVMKESENKNVSEIAGKILSIIDNNKKI